MILHTQYMDETQTLNEHFQELLEHAKKQAGVNDIEKFHRDYMERINRNRLVSRTQRHKGMIITTDSTS